MRRFAFRPGIQVIGLRRMARAVVGLVTLTASAWASEPNAQKVNHFVGAAGESVSIQVPPFHGIEPRLGLSYSSEARNGFAGMGWSLSGVSVIERVNHAFGYPHGDESDTFQLDGQPMAPCEAGAPWSTYPSCATGGTHYTIQESYLRIKKVNDALWEVYGKDGTKTEFTPIYTPGGLPTLRYGQSKVVDTHNNIVVYNWDVNADVINGNTYISSIEYNGYRVRFLRETRSDVLTQGVPGLPRQTQRLSAIIVELTSGAKIRGYKLGYEMSPVTGKSLLKTVQMFGKDLTAPGNQITGGTSLPAQTFGYQTDAAAATLGGDVQLTPADCGGAKRFSGDFNGDSRQDFVCRNNDGNVLVNLATASGFANPMIWASSGEGLVGAGDFNNDGRDDIVFYDSFWGTTSVGLSNGLDFGAITAWGAITGRSWASQENHACRMDGAKIAKVADFTGDGKADLLCYRPVDPGKQFVAVSTGTYFYSEWLFSETDCPAYDSADANADGREDVACITPDGPNAGDLRTLISTGNWFHDTGVLPSFCSAGEFSFGDWNGDGTTDTSCANNGRTALRTGGGWVDLGTPDNQPYCVAGQRLSVDLDGDGAAEWICNNPGNAGNDIEVRRWTGLAFGAVQTLRGGFCSGLLTVADTNGDGKKDFLCESAGVIAYSGSQGVKADLLTSSANGLGGSSTFNYNTTTQHLPGSTAGLPVKYIVVATTANDGRTAPATTAFGYETGAQDDKERKFFGFQRVVEYPPGPWAPIDRRYRIDAAAAGRLTEVIHYSGPGAPMAQTLNEYLATESTGPGARRTVHLSATRNVRYTGGVVAWCASFPCAHGRRTRVEYTYDLYGNLNEVKNFGDMDTADDETLTRYSGARNTAAYIVGLQSMTQSWKGLTDGGLLLRKVTTSYDGGSWDAVPTKGDLERTFRWLAEEGPDLASPKTVHDAHGNPALAFDSQDRLLGTTTYSNNTFPTSFINGLGESTTTTWDYVCGMPSSTTDANGVTTTFASDALCRPTTTTVQNPLVVASTRSYIDLGNPTTQRVRQETPGPAGSTDWSESYFDGFGRTYATAKKGPSVEEWSMSEVGFDARGNVAWQSTPTYANVYSTRKITTFAYDELNRRTLTTLPGGQTRTTGYPVLSTEGFFRVAETNELGQVTMTNFDGSGRLRRTETDRQPSGHLATLRDYDILGRLTEVKDPLGNTWTYAYDFLGRVVAKNDPDAGVWTYSYDDEDRIKSQTDAKGQTTTFEYDLLGRLKYKKLRPSGGASGEVTETTETTYGSTASANNVGRPIQVVTRNAAGADQSGKISFEYDALGRVTKQTRTIDGADYVVEKNYDVAGYLLGMKYPDGDILGQFGGTGTALGYDGAGRLTSIPGILNNVTYSALGAPLVQTNANGTTTTKTYDANRFWLTDINTTTPLLTLQDLHYNLNSAGMAEAVTSPFGTEGWTYGYDDLNRLTSATNTASTTNNQTWTYDNIGRITYNSKIGTYSYASPRPHAVTAAGGNTYTDYDANGNLKVGGGRTLTWDANNMITQVAMGPSTTTFTYGPDGARIQKSSASGTVKYPFGDDYEIDGSTATKYFDAGFGVIAKKVGSSLFWLHTDRLGSINATTDASGAEQQRRSYRGYGEAIPTPVVWTAKVNTVSSGSELSRTLTTWAWDAGAVSVQSIPSGDGYVEVTATPDYVMFGLSNGNSGPSYEDIDYGIFTVYNGFYVYENGVQRTGFQGMSAGDKMRVSVEGGVVKYWHNGTLVYTSTVPPNYPLLVDTALVYLGGLQEVVISGATTAITQSAPQPVAWTAKVNTLSSGSALSRTLTTWAWDAGAVSVQSIPSGDGYVEVTATPDYVMFGLSNGNSSPSYEDIDYGIFTVYNGFYVFENGVQRTAFQGMSAGDRMRVSVEGGVVTYRHNGTLVYTSTVPPNYPLLVDTALVYLGGLQEVVIAGAVSPPEALGYIGQRTDGETGLTYLHARYYDPVLGIFLSPDPAAAEMNTYRYGNGDPVNFSDPSGLESECGDFAFCRMYEEFPEYSNNWNNVLSWTPSSQTSEMANALAEYVEALNTYITTGTSSTGEEVTVTTTFGFGTVLLAVGDPGKGDHNYGDAFNLAAATSAVGLKAAGYSPITQRISSVQDFASALTRNGTLQGVTYFGHGGTVPYTNGTRYSGLHIGEETGFYTNLTALNVGLLSGSKLAANAEVTLNACHAGLGGSASIAQTLANQLGRQVNAYAAGMFVSNNPNARNYTTAGPLSPSLPAYMLPENRSPLIPFNPRR